MKPDLNELDEEMKQEKHEREHEPDIERRQQPAAVEQESLDCVLEFDHAALLQFLHKKIAQARHRA